MPKVSSRPRRVGELIQRELAELIRREVSAPALGLVTVSAVEVSTDLCHAKVYFTTLGSSLSEAESAQLLMRHVGELRHGLAQRMTTRTTPRLNFVYDSSIAYGNHLAKLIEAVAPADEATQPDKNPHD